MRERSASFGAAAALAACLLLPAAVSAAEPARPGCGQSTMSGTFYQPLARHLDWDPHRWAEIDNALQELGMSEIFVQWSAADGIAFFPTAARAQLARSPLEPLFDIATRHGIGVWVGLELDQAFLPVLRKPAVEVQAHLAIRERQLAAILPDLAAYLRRKEAMAGWYISAELDDGAWIDSAVAGIVRTHLKRLSFMLKSALDRPVAISTFANGTASPERLAAFWRDIGQGADIDLLLFQDGVGAGKLTPAQSALYAERLAMAMQAEGRQFGVIVEQFGEPAPGAASKEPVFSVAPAARVRQQLDAIAGFAQIRRIAFTLFDYILPEQGERPLLGALLEDRLACPPDP